MVKFEKLRTVTQAKEYFKKDFANERENYFSRDADHTVQAVYSGSLAAEMELEGTCSQEEYERLIQGQHPITGEQLIRNVQPREYTTEDGEIEMSNGHVPGMDLNFAMPKSFSGQAVYGKDERFFEWHDEAKGEALAFAERYAMAHMGGNHQPEVTGKLLVVEFNHTSTRREDGIASPHIHTHAIAINLQKAEDGKFHALQNEEMMRIQQVSKEIYFSHLEAKAIQGGYETEIGKYGEPEIQGVPREWIEAVSLRRNSLEERAKSMGVDLEDGKSHATLMNSLAKQNRESKQSIDQQKTEQFMNEKNAEYRRAFEERTVLALERGERIIPSEQRIEAARNAVDYARDHRLERSATVSEDRLYQDALHRSRGTGITFQDVSREVAERKENGEFVTRRESRVSQVLTTQDMQRKEEEIIAKMQHGKGVMEPVTRDSAALLKHVEQSSELKEKGITLNDAQQRVFDQVMTSEDQIQAINGFAGTGKTTEVQAMRIGWEWEGYTVRGFGTTGKNTNQLGETGMNVETLASHLQKGDKAHQQDGKVVYVLDESSLASTNQVHQFLTELRSNERVVLVGDTRQHQSVEWGKPFEQLQAAGMETAQLDKIVRQKNPALEEMVYRLERGDTAGAIQVGRENHVFVEEKDPQKRLEYLTEAALNYRQTAQERMPGETARQHEARQRIILITPENARKREINETLRVKMQQRGWIGKEDYKLKVLEPRQEVTKAQKTWAANYEVGDTLRYYKGNRQLGIDKDDSARLTAKDTAQNTITVEFETGKSAGHQLTYDPSKGGNGVAIYRETERTFSPGQDVQFTAKARLGDVEVKNRDLGKFQSIDEHGYVSICHEKGQEVRFHLSEYRHLEQGGCYTSQIAQGQTAGMSGADFGAKNPDLVTFRAMLITASRAQHECKIVAPDLAELEKLIARDVSQETALPESKYRQTDGHNREQKPPARGERHEYGVAPPLRREQTKGGLREELRPEFGCKVQTANDRQTRSLEEELQPEFGHSIGRHIGPVHMPAAPMLEAAGRQAQEAQRSLSGTLSRERIQAREKEDLAAHQRQIGPGQDPGEKDQQKHQQSFGQAIVPKTGGAEQLRQRKQELEQEQGYGFGLGIGI